MIKSIFKYSIVAAAIVASSACTRIETGSTGVRINASKEVQPGELLPGTWNQTVIGDVLIFPTKDITIDLQNKTPMTAENTALADFDITVVYGINPASVADLYSTKSKSFHAMESDGDVVLMYNYMSTLVNNASYKVVRKYTNLEAADNRPKIEQEIREAVTAQLESEKLGNALTLTVVQVRNVLPNSAILESATALVRSQNELKVKENEVKIAEAEARRMKALAENSGQSIAYMNAQATLTLAEAAKEGKVNTILIPHGMTMFGSTGK